MVEGDGGGGLEGWCKYSLHSQTLIDDLISQLLPSDIRGDYLPMLTDFLTTDNNRNWRFRFELAE